MMINVCACAKRYLVKNGFYGLLPRMSKMILIVTGKQLFLDQNKNRLIFLKFLEHRIYVF